MFCISTRANGASPDRGRRLSPVARLVVALALVLGALPLGIMPGQADPGPRVPFPLYLTRDFPASCSFNVHQEVSGNQETAKVNTDADGTLHFQVRGNVQLIESNTSNNKSVALNLSSPIDITVYPDGKQLIEVRGRSVLGFFNPPGNTRPLVVQPGVYLFHGRVTFRTEADGFITSFDTTGRVENLCQTLA